MRTLAKKLLLTLFDSPLFDSSYEDMGAAILIRLFLTLDFIEKQVKAQKGLIRERLLEQLRESGSSPKGGVFEVVTPEGKGRRTDRVEKVPSEDALVALLREKSIPLERLYDRQETWVVNPSKLERLIYNGTLSRNEVDALKSTTPTLRVTANKSFKSELLELRTRNTQEVDE